MTGIFVQFGRPVLRSNTGHSRIATAYDVAVGRSARPPFARHFSRQSADGCDRAGRLSRGARGKRVSKARCDLGCRYRSRRTVAAQVPAQEPHNRIRVWPRPKSKGHAAHAREDLSGHPGAISARDMLTVAGISLTREDVEDGVGPRGSVPSEQFPFTLPAIPCEYPRPRRAPPRCPRRRFFHGP